MMIKLKSILKEGFAWERKADGSLPTLADTAAAYERKMREQAELNMANLEDDIDEAAKPDYIDIDKDGDTEEPMKSAAKDADDTDSNFSEYSDSALRDMKINLARFEGNEEEIKDINRELERRKKKTNETAKPDYIDLDKDGDTEEPMKKAAKDVNESILITKGGLQALREIPLETRIRKNYIGNK
jgi:hypothetical protein